MAKKSKIAAQRRREQVVARYAERRAELKETVRTGSPAQREAAQTWREANPEATREARRAQREAQRDALNAALADVLTPEQAEQYQSLQQQRIDRRGERADRDRRRGRRAR